MAEEKADKPKKLFKLEFLVWDDGEVQRDLVEYVYGDRGAPKQWRMEPKDMIRSMKAQVGGKLELFGAIMASMNVSVGDLQKMFGGKTQPLLEEDDEVVGDEEGQELDEDEKDMDFDD